VTLRRLHRRVADWKAAWGQRRFTRQVGRWSSADLAARVEELRPWHYQFDLADVRTPISQSKFLNRHRQRHDYFFNPLVTLHGGSLAGQRVLDLGCNAGFWSLAAARAGCDFVLGLDGRANHLRQGELVFAANRVPPQLYRFIERDVFGRGFEDLGTYEIVLCLGLLYHVNKPVELFERIAAVNTDTLLVDTQLSTGAGAALEIRREDPEHPLHALRSDLIFVPTRDAVIELLRSAGYAGVVLRPAFDDYEGAEDFRDGTRRAFLCRRDGPLAVRSDLIELSF
jgi:2-polyprenyl-3-methyl-5-hydroxy-6-metoxy-1,4-benzoquinol methylase